MKHLRTMKDLTREDCLEIFHLADRARVGIQVQHPVVRYSMAAIWMQPSTRTRLAFELAAQRLGMDVVSFTDPGTMATAKGESFHHTIRSVSKMVSVVVMRYHEADLADLFSSVPTVNAGSLMDHPTQALTDLYVLWKRSLLAPSLKYRIAWAAGDRPRAMRSFEEGMRMFNVRYGSDLHSDIIYISRQSWKPKVDDLLITSPDAVILHPGPMVGELKPEVWESQRFLGWEQAAASPFVKAAILEWVLE